ncbi:MAG: hypothetical protein GKR94_02585 [Gammaproteobacteria bacterium]|nr:hypothetical protein [Gammaproteobacteria bacterium]
MATKHTNDYFTITGNNGNNSQSVNLNGTYYRYDGSDTNISAWSSITNPYYEYERLTAGGPPYAGTDFFYYLREDNDVALLKTNLNWTQDPDDQLRFSNVKSISGGYTFPGNLPPDNTNAIPYAFVAEGESATDTNIEKYTLKSVFGGDAIAIPAQLGGGTMTWKQGTQPTDLATRVDALTTQLNDLITVVDSNTANDSVLNNKFNILNTKYVLNKETGFIYNLDKITNVHVHFDGTSQPAKKVFEFRFANENTDDVLKTDAVWSDSISELVSAYAEGASLLTQKGNYVLDKSNEIVLNLRDADYISIGISEEVQPPEYYFTMHIPAGDEYKVEIKDAIFGDGLKTLLDLVS